MLTASRTLHALAGSPAFAGAEALEDAGHCYICAERVERGMPVRKWSGSKTTDQNKARCMGAEYVCEACLWSCSWVVPPGHAPPEPGKKGVNLCLFTHLYDAGAYVYAHKGHKPTIRDWLRAPKRGPWFAAIADTGKKHTLPWAPMNGGPHGAVLFEEAEIDLPRDDAGWRVLDDTAALLTAGATKDEIMRGDYRPQTWQRCMRDVQSYEAAHASLRGSAWHRLIVWLAQRDEDQVAERQAAEKEQKDAKKKHKSATQRGRKGATAEVHGERDPGAARAVPRQRRQRAQALDADRGQDPGGGASVRDATGVGEQAEERPTDPADKQLALF